MEKVELNPDIKTSSKKRPELDSVGQSINAFFLRKLGHIRVPQVVPLNFIATSNRCTINQARYRIKILIKLGYIERWSTKHNIHYKQTFYRIPYLHYNKIGYSYKQGKIIKKQATYAPSIGVSAYSKEIKKEWDKNMVSREMY